MGPKKKNLFFFFLCFLLFIPAQAQKIDNPVPSDEIKKAEQFVAEHFFKAKLPPFSFIYDGKASASFLTRWTFAEEKKKIDDHRTLQISTYTDPKTGLIVRALCTVYNDFPAVEWVLKFKNSSRAQTPIIENIQAVDTDFRYSGPGNFILHRALGSNAATCRVKLHGLAPGAVYALNFEDYGIKISESGNNLLEEGLEIKIPAAPGSLLITYKQVVKD